MTPVLHMNSFVVNDAGSFEVQQSASESEDESLLESVKSDDEDAATIVATATRKTKATETVTPWLPPSPTPPPPLRGVGKKLRCNNKENNLIGPFAPVTTNVRTLTGAPPCATLAPKVHILLATHHVKGSPPDALATTTVCGVFFKKAQAEAAMREQWKVYRFSERCRTDKTDIFQGTVFSVDGRYQTTFQIEEHLVRDIPFAATNVQYDEAMEGQHERSYHNRNHNMYGSYSWQHSRMDEEEEDRREDRRFDHGSNGNGGGFARGSMTNERTNGNTNNQWCTKNGRF